MTPHPIDSCHLLEDPYEAKMKKFVLVLVEGVTHSEEEEKLLRYFDDDEDFPLKSESLLEEFLETAKVYGHLKAPFLFRVLYFLLRLDNCQLGIHLLEKYLGIDGERVRSRLRMQSESTLMTVFSNELFRKREHLNRHFSVMAECFLPYVNSFISIKQGLLLADETFSLETIHRFREPFTPYDAKSFLHELMGTRGLVSLRFRLSIAEILLKDHYALLSEHVLYLFSEEEIVSEPALEQLIKKIDRMFVENNVKTPHYYRFVKLYLKTYLKFPFFRPMGEVRIRSPEMIQPPPSDLTIPNYLKKDTPLWRSIGKILVVDQLFWAFKLDRDFDYLSKMPYRFSASRVKENFKLSYGVLFPATISIYSFSRYRWAESLGYRNYSGPSGYYAIIPDPTLLIKNWEKVWVDLPPPSIKLQQENAGSIDEFNQSFQTNEFYISSGSHFIHDQFQHLLPTLNIRINRALYPGYLHSLKYARALHFILCDTSRELQTKGGVENLIPAKIFRLTAAIFVDIFMIQTNLRKREQMCSGLEKGDFFSALWYGKNSYRWKRLYPEETTDFSDEMIERAIKMWLDAGNSR